MVSGINAAASGMMAQQLNIDVISNNLANVNTPGFKALMPVFKRVSDIELQILLTLIRRALKRLCLCLKE